jgi:amino-acid N-acetyltransferase
MFRGSAPYISMHRGAVMVLHIPGDIIGQPVFERTLDDVALMSLLGVKIVIVCGCAAQVNDRSGRDTS